MTEEMTPGMKAAAFWGSAGNAAYSVRDRLVMALQALEYFGPRCEQLEDEAEESDQLRNRMAGLLRGTANALKGEPGELESHDWSDLPVVAARVMRELEGCRSQAEAMATYANRDNVCRGCGKPMRSFCADCADIP